MMRAAFAAPLRGPAAGAPGGAERTARRVAAAAHGRGGPESRRPGRRGRNKAPAPRPRGQAGPQRPRGTGAPARAGTGPPAWQRLPPPPRAARSGPERGRGRWGASAPRLIDHSEPGGAQLHGAPTARRSGGGGPPPSVEASSDDGKPKTLCQSCAPTSIPYVV
jgi:hypothetical protein